jgi:hypothetical protein
LLITLEMRSRTTTTRGAYAAGALFSALIACSADVHDHDNFREDVAYCEEAVAYLGECCPGFDTHAVVCQYHLDYIQGSCGSPSTTDSETPALSLAENAFTLGAKCGSLIGAGVCARAQKATPYTSMTSSGGDTSYSHSDPPPVGHAPVCRPQ